MTYELIRTDENGREERLYPDGSTRDQNGRILKHGGSIKPQITTENAREFHKMRKEKVLKAIEQGVMRVTDAPNPAEAIGRIVQKRAELALTDNTRVGNDAAKIVLAALDAYQDKQQETIQTERKELLVSPDTLRVVEAMLRLRRDGVEITAENITEIE